MDSTESTPQKTGLARFRNRKGFSLVEIAIVLVIIGIIIGAIVKGQDLILNSRAKQVTNVVQTWNNIAHAFFDRNGRWPGDLGKNGVIGDDAVDKASAAVTAIGELEATMQNAPANPVVVGGISFWVYFGNVTVTSGVRNAMIICADAACTGTFSADQLEYIKVIDTAIDGVADAGLGQFRSMINAAALANPAAGNTAGGRATAGFNSLTAPNIVAATPGTTRVWATADTTAVWAFDRQL